MYYIWVEELMNGSACAFENISHFDFRIFNAQANSVDLLFILCLRRNVARGLSPSLVFCDLVLLGDKQEISMGE